MHGHFAKASVPGVQDRPGTCVWAGAAQFSQRCAGMGAGRFSEELGALDALNIRFLAWRSFL